MIDVYKRQATDLAITGANAFFIVSSGGETFFTRAGNFTRDEAGALVTQSGANVMGWQVDPETGDVCLLYTSRCV